MDIIDKIHLGVIEGDSNSVQELVQQALTIGTSTEKIFKEELISAMSVVGNRFEAGEYFVPEMLISARAMKAGRCSRFHLYR